MKRTCPHCTVTLTRGYLCTDGRTEVTAMLQRFGSLLDDLEAVRNRQVRFTTPGRRGSNGRPLPLNLDAAELIRTLDRIARTFSTALWDWRYPTPFTPTPIRDTSTWQRARWIAAMAPVEWPLIGDLWDELHESVPDAVKITEAPPVKVYLGQCSPDADQPCTTVLWAEPGTGHDDNVTTCPRCGAQHDVATRQAAISDRVAGSLADRVMTATNAAEALVAAGLVAGPPDKVAARVRRLASPRKNHTDDGHQPAALQPRLTLTEPGQRPRPGYRVGDVLALLTKGKPA